MEFSVSCEEFGAVCDLGGDVFAVFFGYFLVSVGEGACKPWGKV